MRIRIVSILAVLLFSISGLKSQIPMDSIIPAEYLIEDLRILRNAVLNTHQNPYTYCSLNEIDEAFERAMLRVENGQCYLDFAKTCGDFLKVFKDSHTSVNFSGLYGYLRSQDARVLNIKVRSLNGKQYILKDKDGILSSGLELKEINGVDVQTIWSEISDIGVYEGDSDTGFVRITDAIFPYLVQMVVGVDKINTLKYVDPQNGEEMVTELPGYTFEELKKKAKKKKYIPYEFWVDHEYSMAYLRISTFAHNKRPKYYKFLRQSYNRIQSSGVENLVLDLRGNTGGLINRAEMLITMFTDTTIYLPKVMIAKQTEVSRDYYDRKYKGLNRWFINHFYKNNEKVSSYRTIMNLEVGETDTLAFSEERLDFFPRFEGNSYLLIDGASGSASALFASAFSRNELGMILGEDCLGPASGTWGNPTNIRLKNSGMNILISVLRTNGTDDFLIDPTPVSPQVHLEYQPNDLYNHIDLELEFIKDLIKR